LKSISKNGIIIPQRKGKEKERKVGTDGNENYCS